MKFVNADEMLDLSDPQPAMARNGLSGADQPAYIELYRRFISAVLLIYFKLSVAVFIAVLAGMWVPPIPY